MFITTTDFKAIKILAIVAALFLFSCGGGGGNDSEDEQAPLWQPTNLKAEPIAGGIRLSWKSQRPDDVYSGFNVYMASESGVDRNNYSNLLDGKKLRATGWALDIHCLENHKKYYFVVEETITEGAIFWFRTKISKMSSEVSNIPLAKPLGSVTSPASFTVLSGVDSISLFWEHNPRNQNIEYYTVYFAKEPWTTWHEGLDSALQVGPLVFDPLNIFPPSLTFSSNIDHSMHWFQVTASCGIESDPSKLTSGQKIEAGTWTTLAPMPDLNRDSTGVSILNELYITGQKPSDSFGALYAYDIAANVWEEKAPPIVPRHSATSASYDGKMYVAGGINDEGYLDIFEVYDPIGNTWTILAPLLSKRSHGDLSVFQNKIYLLGGIGSSGEWLQTLDVYDVLTDTWETVATLPIGGGDISTEFIGPVLYIMDSGGWFSNFYSYDVESGQYNKLPAKPYNSYKSSSVTIGGELYVVGGNQGNTLTIYNPANQTWISQKRMSVGRSNPISAVINGEIYVAAGYRSDHINTLEKYTPP